jgi:hypothetical protein
MIGSVSESLKVHVQEARNESTIAGSYVVPGLGEFDYSIPASLYPRKSEDLAYSETSTSSGLINTFSTSMSYSSQASAVAVPPTVTPGPVSP